MKEMKRIFVIFVLVLLIATVFGAAYSVYAPKGGGGKPPEEDPTLANPEIAYISGGRNDYGLWVMDADGTHQTHVPISDSVYPWMMSWSPDGTCIAITSRPVNTVSMYLWSMDIAVDTNGKVQGSNAEKLLTESIRPGYVVWSPNGDLIAYSKANNYYEDPPYSIWLYDVTDGTTEKIYTDTDDVIEYLTWDPSGTKLAFVQDVHYTDTTGKSPKLVVLDVATKTADEIRTLTSSSYSRFYGGGLDWANGDDKIACIHNGVKIAIIDLSEETYDILESGAAVIPSWSPDDSKITYQTFKYVKAKGRDVRVDIINTIDVSTEEVTTLAEGNTPEWQR
jgi:Tol biopolymer transport system component